MGRVIPAPPTDVLCLLGTSPAVLTELLWALAQEDRRLDRLTVVTTRGGRKKHGSLYDDGAKPGPKLCELFDAHPSTRVEELHVVEIPEEDAGTTKATKKVGHEIDRALTRALRPSIPLVACLSGGRKSMSAWLTIAMTVRGRPGDKLVHVVVPDALTRPEVDFWFPRADENAVSLVDIPYVRATEHVRSALTLEAAVREATESIARHSLEIEPDRPCEVRIDGTTHRLKRSVWALLAVYAERARRGDERVVWQRDVQAHARLKELAGRDPLHPNMNAFEKLQSELRSTLRAISPALAACIVRARPGGAGGESVSFAPKELAPWVQSTAAFHRQEGE